MTILDRLKRNGRLRQGRRTPETVYASFDENLDDRSTNFPLLLVPDVPLGKFIVEAVNEKLARGRRPADPEAWLADQLAHLPTLPDVSAMVRDGWGMMPGSAEFAAVQKLAQEYGEMCAARATADFEDLTIVVKDEGEMKVLVGGNTVMPLEQAFPGGAISMREMGAGPLAVTHGLEDA